MMQTVFINLYLSYNKAQIRMIGLSISYLYDGTVAKAPVTFIGVKIFMNRKI